MSPSPTHLTEEQKQRFFRDGFVVIKSAVPHEISQKARELISARLPKDERKLLVPAERDHWSEWDGLQEIVANARR